MFSSEGISLAKVQPEELLPGHGGATTSSFKHVILPAHTCGCSCNISHPHPQSNRIQPQGWFSVGNKHPPTPLFTHWSNRVWRRIARRDRHSQARNTSPLKQQVAGTIREKSEKKVSNYREELRPFFGEEGFGCFWRSWWLEFDEFPNCQISFELSRHTACATQYPRIRPFKTSAFDQIWKFLKWYHLLDEGKPISANTDKSRYNNESNCESFW